LATKDFTLRSTRRKPKIENTSSAPRRLWLATLSVAVPLLLLSPTQVVADTATSPVDRVELVTFTSKTETLSREGRVLLEDSDGGVLLEEPSGRQWVIEAANVVSRDATKQVFTPLTQEQLGTKLLAELPDGFSIHSTPHYLVCYNTSRSYAMWTSSLLERLHRAFTNYWSSKGVELTEPEFPLVVVVYASQQQYRVAASEELGEAANSIIGYYSLTSNRVSMYDITGAEELRAGSNRRGSLKQVNQMLSRPAAAPLVATIVHEATHQIAFNCGLQTRLADLPLWLVEGMAVYFEAPDLTSSRGWRGIGKINHARLQTFKANLHSPRRSTVLALIAEDKQFRSARSAVNAYADAWALNYYLIKYHPTEYVAYVEMLSSKPPLADSNPEERIADFITHFGEVAPLEKQFLKRMGGLR